MIVNPGWLVQSVQAQSIPIQNNPGRFVIGSIQLAVLKSYSKILGRIHSNISNNTSRLLPDKSGSVPVDLWQQLAQILFRSAKYGLVTNYRAPRLLTLLLRECEKRAWRTRWKSFTITKTHRRWPMTVKLTIDPVNPVNPVGSASLDLEYKLNQLGVDQGDCRSISDKIPIISWN